MNEIVYIYINNLSPRVRTIINYFNMRNIDYEVKNTRIETLTKDDLLKMLRIAINGFDAIIDRKSPIYRSKGKAYFDNLATTSLIDFILRKPSILKDIILLNELDIDANPRDHDLEVFLPVKEKKRLYEELMAKSNYLYTYNNIVV